jgi:hypothetical protein
MTRVEVVVIDGTVGKFAGFGLWETATAGKATASRKEAIPHAR